MRIYSCALFSVLFFSVTIAITSCVATLPNGITSSTRSEWLAQLDGATESDPPNLEVIIEGLFISDWLVATVAADRLGQLALTNRLAGSDIDLALQALQRSLARGGHWWLLGWDEEGSGYGAFRSAATYGLSRFGSRSLPTVKVMLEAGSVRQQEAACWVLVEILEDDIVTVEQIDKEITLIVSELARGNPDSSVGFACQRLLEILP